MEDWARVIFTDEMSIKLNMKRHSKDYVWYKVEEEFHSDCISYDKRPVGTGMMFWGTFRKGHIGPGVFFELGEGQHVDSMVYRDQILLGPLKDFWEESFGDLDEPIVMEDNAPVHTKVCIPVREQLGITCLQHLPNSPDLNPIENIWGYIKDIIARDYAHITSVKTMKQVVIGLWNEFVDNQWDNLIESMSDRMQAVIAARGGSTRY